MFEIVQTLSLSSQREMFESLKEGLRTSPLHQMVMPARGISRKTNCTGICEECWLGHTGDPRMKVTSTNLGPWGWVSTRCGYHYVETHPRTGKSFPEIPEMIRDLSQSIAREAGYELDPQSAYINIYTETGKLGLHQDNSELNMDAPVISFSLGEEAVFLRGGMRYSDPVERIRLRSGDVMVMGAPHRLTYHGIERILSGTVPAGLGIKAGRRINVTVRQYT